MKLRQTRSEDEPAVNLTPLIDVVFILLIFFMVSTTFTRETQLSIDLPEADGMPREAAPRNIEILVDEGGQYRVNGQSLVDNGLRTLQAAVYKVSAGDTTLPMTITADAQAQHQFVVRAMDAVARMGFAQLSIAARQPSGEGDSGG